jgi:cell wall hydrolase
VNHRAESVSRPRSRISKVVASEVRLSVPQFTTAVIPPLEAVGLRAVSPSDMTTMAETVLGEARGEALIVQVGVAWCVVARVLAARRNPGRYGWWGSTPGEVCLKPWQFSCWNADSPSLSLMKAARMGATPEFNRALGACLLVLSGNIANPCAGYATHYHDPSISTPDAWKVMTPVAGPAPMTWFREGAWS